MKPTSKHATQAAFLGLVISFATAPAATIYSETFSDGSVGTPSLLDGSTPDVTTGGATWSASLWEENGSTARITSAVDFGTDDSAFLPFTPGAGNVYTLSATATVPVGGSGSWVALGFADTNITSGQPFWANGTAPWMLYRQSSEVTSFAESLGTAPNNDLGVDTNNVIAGNYATSADLTIVLDTTGTAWTAEWLVDGSPVRSETYGTNPSINFVGFARENGESSDIDNFTLTVIPEPSSVALLGLGGLALLRRRRRK